MGGRGVAGYEVEGGLLLSGRSNSIAEGIRTSETQ